MGELESLWEFLGTDFENALRETLPAPPMVDSGIRVQTTRMPLASVQADIVMCDLSRDPRSDDYTRRRSRN